MFVAPDGTDYGLNGTAMDFGHKDIEPIWADNPTGLTPKLSIGPLIEAGLKLCDSN